MASWRKEASHHLSDLLTPGILGIIVPTSMLSTWWRGGDCWGCWKMLKVDADCLYSKWLGDWGFQFWLSITPKWHDHMTELTISHFLKPKLLWWVETCWKHVETKIFPYFPNLFQHLSHRKKRPRLPSKTRRGAWRSRKNCAVNGRKPFGRGELMPFGEDHVNHGIEPPVGHGESVDIISYIFPYIPMIFQTDRGYN